ncbi:hypothetical protein ACIQU6_38310 [Streptomyces sp. NPDC090442]|uniref:hypothetical protein n=1 Tax=Streptomyces sp. NPDC090442 TaxID=3365962 RepID=UPI00380DD31F
MSILGWIALTLGSGCTGISRGDTSAGVAWGLLATGVVLVAAGVWAVLRGRQHLTPVLDSLHGLAVDERIVLFLRSFKDDDGFSQVAARRWFRLLFASMLPTPAHLLTEEDQVGRAFAPFGRMVALGSPSDGELPRLGAERHYASDPTWWDEVLAALDRSALVVLATGAGRGLTKEVEELVARNDPTRLVLLVSRDRQQYTKFRESLGGKFPNGLPDYPPKRLRHRLLQGRYVRAAIWFDSDWTPHWEMLDGRFPLIGLARRTQKALPRALRKVYQRAGVPARVTPTAPRPWAVKLSVPLIAAFWLTPVAVVLSVVPVTVFVVNSIVKAFAKATHAPSGIADGFLMTPSDSRFNALHDLSTGWPLWLWVAVVAVCGYRVWRGGPYAIMMTRIQGVFLPVFTLAFVMAKLPSRFVPLFVGLGLLVLVVLGMPVAAVLLLRRDVREWVDSRL